MECQLTIDRPNQKSAKTNRLTVLLEYVIGYSVVL